MLYIYIGYISSDKRNISKNKQVELHQTKEVLNGDIAKY